MSDETQNNEMDRVIARIQKLLSRSKTEKNGQSTGASEAEAETAMKLAQDLMMKHNLDMAVIEAASNATETAVERVKEESKSRVRFKWQRQLAKYVAEANFCYHLVKTESEWRDGRYVPCTQEGDHNNHTYADGKDCFRSSDGDGVWKVYVRGGYKTSYQHIFVGRKANVITAQLMFKYLTETIELTVPVKTTGERFSKAAVSWKEGCADRLCERLAQKRADLIEQNDARIRQEDADRKAEIKRAYEEKQKGKHKELPPNEGAEVKSAISDMEKESYEFIADPPPEPEHDRPEADAADVWNPADEEESPEAETGTSLVLASVYDQREQEANYEAAHDLPLGYLAEQRAAREKREREQEEEDAKEAAEEEIAEVEKPVKEETERQRAARLRREQEAYAKERRRWAREDAAEARKAEREYAKRDHSAYRAGAEAGKGIGLDLQVKARADAKKLTSGGE